MQAYGSLCTVCTFTTFSSTCEQSTRLVAIALYKPKSAYQAGLRFFQGV